MAKRAYGKRRKGISIAAGLVALSLVAQVAPATVLPTQPAVASAAENENATPETPVADGAPIDADGIASGVVTKMDQLGDYKWVNDQRKNTHGGMVGGRLFSPGTGDFSTVGDGNERLTGYAVYSQWMDEDGAVSPVYKAQTHKLPGTSGGDGSYVFHYPNWTDGNGKEHTFNAKPMKVKIRLWIAPGQEGPGGQELKTIRQAPGVQPGFMNEGDGGVGMWSNVPESFQYTGIFTYEPPSEEMYAKEGDPRFHVDKKGWGGSFGEEDKNSVSGSVWWETGASEAPLSTITFPQSTSENFAKNGSARVVTSVLTDEGVAAFSQINKLPRAERVKKQKELLRANPKYIAETVAAETDAQGRYYARFNTKNWDNKYLYQFVQVNRDGKWVTQPAYSSYIVPMYGDPTKMMNIPQTWQDVRHSWTAMHFGLVRQPTENDLNISESIVKAGDKVTPNISAYVYEGEEAYVQWFDGNGNAIDLSGNKGEQKIPVTGGHNIANPFDAATITIPNAKTLQKSGNTTFTARLYVNGKLVDADSVSVNKEPKTAVEGNPKKVDRTDKKQSTGLKIVNKDGDTEVSAVDANGKKIPVTVNDKTGEISVTPGTDAKGPIKVTVKDPDLKDGESTYEVPVTSDSDENTPEGKDVTVKVGETPKAEDAIKNKDALPKGTTFKFEKAPDTSKEDTVPAKVIVTYPDGSTDVVDTNVIVTKDPTAADTNTPEGKDVTVKVGETPKAEDAIKNKDALPKGTTFMFEKAPDTSKEDTVPAKVIVTYPDGSTDEVTTTINVKDPDKVTQPTIIISNDEKTISGKTDPGAEVTVTIPGVKDPVKVIADENGNYKVEVPEGTTLKDGDTVKVTAKVEGKGEASNWAKISKSETSDSSIDGLTQDEANKCVGASAASAIPLLLLTPIALGLAMDNQQVKDLTAGFGKQLEDINTGIQKTLGIYNPELAQQFKVQVAPHLQNLVLAAGFVASIALLAGVAATQCVPGGGSSDNTTAQQ